MYFWLVLLDDLLGQMQAGCPDGPSWRSSQSRRYCLSKLGWLAARLVGVARARSGWCPGVMHLVGQDDLAVDDAELELGVGNDDAVLGGVVAGDGVDLDGQVAQLPWRSSSPRSSDAALEADVLVVAADLGLGGGREDGLGKLGGVHQARGQLDAADGAAGLWYSFRPLPAR